MENMNETIFLPFDLSLKLKWVGFNDECLGYYLQYDDDTIKFNFDSRLYNQTPKKIDIDSNGVINFATAPTWEQVFDWFERVHKVQVFMEHQYYDGHMFVYSYIQNNGEYGYFIDENEDFGWFRDKKECREKCVEKLIEMFGKTEKV